MRAPCSFALAVSLVLLVTGCRSGQRAVPFDRTYREETFDLFFDRLTRSYPYFESIDVDWGAVVTKARRDALATDSRREYFTRIANALATLEDPHLTLGLPLDGMAESGEVWTTLPLELVLAEGRLLVGDWGSAVAAPPPGVDVPAAAPELVAIDGCPVQLGLLASLLVGPPASSAELLLRWPDGTLTEYTVQRLPLGDRGGWSWSSSVLWDESSWISWARRGDLGVVHVATFDPADSGAKEVDAEADIARVFAALAGIEVLLLDLQYNTGGRVDVMLALGKHLVDEPTPVGRMERSFLGLIPFSHDIVMRPAVDAFEGPLVILVNGRTMSAGEHFARALQRSGRATLIGEKTPGAEAAVQELRARDGTLLVFGERPILPQDGISFQGLGVFPDLEIPLTIEAVRTQGKTKALYAVMRARVAAALEQLGSDVDPSSVPRPTRTDLRVWTPQLPAGGGAD